MKHFLLSLLSVAILSSSAYAQTRFSIEAGAVSSGYSIKAGGRNYFTANKWGGTFAMGFDSKITKHLSIQTGLQYVMNGYRQNTGLGDLSFSLNTLQLPLNAVYKNEKAGGNRIFIGIGPYFAINMFGTRKYSPFDSTEYSYQLNVGNDPRDDIRVPDLGLGINGGYELKGGFFIRIQSQIGLMNMSQINDDNNVIRNRNSRITIGYLTGANKERRMERRGKVFRSHGLEM